MRHLLVSGVAFALLVACSAERGADADGDGEITADEAAAEAASLRIRPGEWETSVQFTEFDMPGMPAEARAAMQEQMGRPQKSSSCITPEQASNPDGGMFAADENEGCAYREFDMSGGTLLIDAVCQPEGTPGSMTMRMEGDYTPTSYSLSMNMAMDGGQKQPVRMSGTVEGRRTGECSDAEPADAND